MSDAQSRRERKPSGSCRYCMVQLTLMHATTPRESSLRFTPPTMRNAQDRSSTTLTHEILQGLRPFEPADITPLARLLWAAHAWPPTAPPAPEEIYQRWKRRNVDPEYNVNVLPGAEGELMAYSQTALFKDGTPRLGFEIAVHPKFRRMGIGSALFDAMHLRAERSNVTHVTAPIYLAVGEETTDGARFLERRGCAADHCHWQMRLDCISDQAKPEWPEGITVRRFGQPGLERDAETWAALIVRCFGEPTTAAGVEAQFREPGVSRDGYFFAVDKRTGREIGTSRARIDKLGGEQIGYIGTVGVLPEYRGRGIAEALLKQTLAYLAGKGMRRATLFVDEQNTPARNLYDKLGWHYVYKVAHYWKRVVSEK
jgi:mycothiol synthase